MTEVVDAIRRVTALMGEISASSEEQSRGVQQIAEEAVTVIDQGTQQNAALVEEMAAAASSLGKPGRSLGASHGRLPHGGRSLESSPAAAPALPPFTLCLHGLQPFSVQPAPAVRHAPAAAPKPAVAAPGKATASDDHWESF